MLFMLWTFDFLFVVVDYFIYLLDPIIARLSAALSFRQPKYSQKWPWLLESRKYNDVSLKGLSYEIEKFYAMRARHLRETSSTRSSLAQLVSKLLRIQWPWLGLHLVHMEPSERQLDWHNHDLGLVADWDCCRLPIAWHQLQQSDQDETPELELVAQTARGEKLLVQIGSEPSHMLTWRLISLRDRKRDKLRSALVFYYTQLHPELTRLHNLLAYLLNDLVEPASSRPVKKASHSVGDRDVCQTNHLSRYAMLLMIVANLQDKNNLKTNIAEQLLDFLSSNSRLSLAGRRIAPKPMRLKHQIRIELVEEERVQEEFSGGKRLEVIDPVELAISQCGKMPVNLADLIAQLQSFSEALKGPIVEEADITRDFCREQEFAERCQVLSEQLKAKLALGKTKDDETILGSLLISSGTPADEYAKPRFTKLLKPQAPLPNLKKMLCYIQQLLCQKVNKEDGHHKQARGRARGWKVNLPWRKVLSNLLYLLIFLLIRDTLIREVLRWRTLINEQARDDWIQLKHHLFPNGYHQDEFDVSDFFNTDH